jgi:hypothetical protein
MTTDTATLYSGWRKCVAYPQHINREIPLRTVMILDTLEELISIVAESRYLYITDLLHDGVEAGLITEAEERQARFDIANCL